MIAAIHGILDQNSGPGMPTTSTPAYWWDPSVNVVLDGSGLVQSCADKISGVVASSSTAANRPGFSTAAINGRPGFTLNGTSQAMKTPALNFSGTNAIKIIQVVKTNYHTSGYQMFCELTNNVNNFTTGFYSAVLDSATLRSFEVAVKGDVGFAIAAAGNSNWINQSLTKVITSEFVKTKTTGESSVMVNNLAGVTSTGNNANNTNNFANDSLYLFARGEASLFLDGAAGDILIFPSNVDNAEIQKWREYIAYKNNITL